MKFIIILCMSLTFHLRWTCRQKPFGLLILLMYHQLNIKASDVKRMFLCLCVRVHACWVLTWCWRPGWCPRAWVCHPALDLSSLGCWLVSGWACTPYRMLSWTTLDHCRQVRQTGTVTTYYLTISTSAHVLTADKLLKCSSRTYNELNSLSLSLFR